MNPKLKRIIAVTALVFVGLFTVSLVAYFANRSLFNGALGYFALGSGAVGLALFFVIKLSKKYPEEESELKKLLDKDENDSEDDNAKVGNAENSTVPDEAAKNPDPQKDDDSDGKS